MKICFVFKEYPLFDNPKSSGVGNSIYHLSQGLSHKHSVFILTQTNRSAVVHQKKVTVISIQRILLHPLFDKRFIRWIMQNITTFFALVHLYRIHRFDVVEFGNWEFEGVLFAPYCYLFHIPIRLVCRLHTGTYDIAMYDRRIKLSVRVLHSIESWAMRLPNISLSTSTESHASHCRKEYQLGNKRIRIIPLGISPIKQTVATLPPRPILEKEQKIVYVGRIEYRKGITTLLQAIPLVVKRNPHAVFYIIGEGVLPIFPMIQKYVPISLWTNIRYLGYVDSLQQLSFFYELADTCVFPSWYESFGFTILEAMSHGKAVISTNTGGIPEVVTSEINGILVPPRNHEALADAILRLLNSNLLRKELGSAGHRLVKTRFSQQRFTQKTEEFYKELCG